MKFKLAFNYEVEVQIPGVLINGMISAIVADVIGEVVKKLLGL